MLVCASMHACVQTCSVLFFVVVILLRIQDIMAAFHGEMKSDVASNLFLHLCPSMCSQNLPCVSLNWQVYFVLICACINLRFK